MIKKWLHKLFKTKTYKENVIKKLHALTKKYEELWDEKKQANPIEQKKIMKRMNKINRKLNKTIKVYNSLDAIYKVPVTTNNKNIVRQKPPIAPKPTKEMLQQKMRKNYNNKEEVIYADLVFDMNKNEQVLKPTLKDKTIYATIIHNQGKKQKENLSANRKKNKFQELNVSN